MNPLLEAALGDAARGIPVYPVHWPHRTPGGANLTCSCPPRPRLRPAGQASPGPSRRLGGHH